MKFKNKSHSVLPSAPEPAMRFMSKEIDIPPWSGNPCVKCECEDIEILYCTSSSGNEHWTYIDDHPTKVVTFYDEHLRLKCNQCKYSWRERCKDAEAPVHDA